MNNLGTRSDKQNTELINIKDSPYEASKNSHAIAILTEWDEFKDYDWIKIFNSMKKPAFIFDGRNLLDKEKIEKIGFVYQGIGKN